MEHEQILDLPQEPQRQLEYAGFGIRLVAIIIDWTLLVVVQAILFGVLGYLLNMYGVAKIIGYIIAPVYFIYMESSVNQATVGKIILGLRVGDEDGNRVSVGIAVGRYFGRILSAITLLVGYLMVLWDDRKQALHDKLAGTYVFYNR